MLGKDEITTMVAAVGACVSLLTFGAVVWRERREGSARAEARAKAVIELLRIAESPTEPLAVREYAKRELHRMGELLHDEAEEERLIERVFSTFAAENANRLLLEATERQPEPLDPDTERLIAVVNYWMNLPRVESGLTRQQEWRIRVSFVILVHVVLFLWVAIIAAQHMWP